MWLQCVNHVVGAMIPAVVKKTWGPAMLKKTREMSESGAERSTAMGTTVPRTTVRTGVWPCAENFRHVFIISNVTKYIILSIIFF